MIALMSVWLGLLCLLLAAVMLVYPPALKEWSLILFLELMAPGALCLAGMVLGSHRRADPPEPGVRAQRLQAKLAIGLTLTACAIVYLIVLVLSQQG